MSKTYRSPILNYHSYLSNSPFLENIFLIYLSQLKAVIKHLNAFPAFLLLIGVSYPCFAQTRAGEYIKSNSLLDLNSQVILPDVKGAFDLMAVDVQQKRLFISATDNHTVEVIDLKTSKWITSITNLNEPKWVVYRPETNLVYVSTGGDGKVTAFDGSTFKFQRSFSFKEKCNNLRYEGSSHQLYVGLGKTYGALGIIDVKTNQVRPEIPLADYPKQFEIDGNRIFVNIPSRNIIQVIDRSLMKVTDTWPVEGAKENIPMAIDRAHHRLFIACDSGKFIVYSTITGKSVTSLTVHQKPDGIYYDEKRARIYVSCGEGFVAVIRQDNADHYSLMENMATAKGAETSLFSPDLNLYIVAVPQSGGQKASIQIYQPAK